MDQHEYMDWWIKLPENYEGIEEPVLTLVQHVEALQGRIDDLPEHDPWCRDYGHPCACAYDHPEAVCMVHARKDSS